MKPSVGRIVHYVSHGTPPRKDGSQAFTSECRAAVITAVDEGDQLPESGVPDVDLFVMNPTGVFLNRQCSYDDGAATKGDPTCPDALHHGSPLRYCPCGWIEPGYRGGTWHWPERVES